MTWLIAHCEHLWSDWRYLGSRISYDDATYRVRNCARCGQEEQEWL